VAFVLADLSTFEGTLFATRYGAGHTTLVFLDASGQQLGRLYGVQNEAYLRNYVRRVFNLLVR
jgi:hypothetical protein